MPNFIEIGGVTRKPLVDLTRNDPLAKSKTAKRGKRNCQSSEAKVYRSGIRTRPGSGTVRSPVQANALTHSAASVNGLCISLTVSVSVRGAVLQTPVVGRLSRGRPEFDPRARRRELLGVKT